MAIQAIHRNARISSRKVRLVANLIRGKYADEALNILKFQPQRGARLLEKVLKSAVGNAADPQQNNGRSYRVEDLVVTNVQVGGGPMFKRVRPMARGMAFMVKKRSSHITVGLSPIDEI